MQIVIGIVLILIGGYFLIFNSKKQANDLLEIQSTDTKTIDEVREALQAMSSIDPNYRELVEVKGFAQTNQPVIAPFSNERVAYYIAKTMQISETTETYTDSDGNRRTRTNKRTDTLSEEESTAPLLLKDNAGNEIVIESNGTSNQFDLQKICDRFDNSNIPYQNRNYSNFRLFDINPMNNYRIIGYKKIEEAFRLNCPLYVFGDAYMLNDKIYIGPPKDSSKPFIVTSKSEEQLVKSKKNSKLFSIIGGAAAIVIGIAVIVAFFI